METSSHWTDSTLARGRPLAGPRAAVAEPHSEGIETGVALWHLRAGLNVAALACKGRGRIPVRGDYGRLLTHHRTLLAAAYSAELHRQGARFDRSETRLYNRFSNQHNPVQFCRDAASVAHRAAAMNSPSLAANAPSLLRELR